MEKKERKIVPVDENVIHDMMAGDIPARRHEAKPPQADGPKPSADAVDDEETTPGPRPRKRKEQRSYGEVYLERLAPMPRKHTYISLKMYNDLEGLLPVIARGVSIPNFLENLLKDHFDTHRDEINELYSENTKKRY